VTRRARRGAILLCLAALGPGCAPEGAGADAAMLQASHPPEASAGRAAAVEPSGERGQEAAAEPVALASVPTGAAVGRTGPGGEPFEVSLRTPQTAAGHARRIGTVGFPIALRIRTPELGQYPCTSCHVRGDPVVTADRATDAHQDIQPVHPAETGATCGTCHAANDVEVLVLLGGARVPLDQAYRMCAQCHAPQVREWEGGAHGKRLDGWRGRRVVMNCADCHDPHQPAVESRIPYPGARLPRTGGHE
jgi:hypothetical protein